MHVLERTGRTAFLVTAASVARRRLAALDPAASQTTARVPRTLRAALNVWAFAFLMLPGCPSPVPPVALTRIEPNSDGTISTVAGTGTAGFGGEGAHSRIAQLNAPMAVAITNDGALMIADFNNHRIRHIDLETGIITTEAGNGSPSGEGSLQSPTTVLPLTDGGFLTAGWGEHRVFEYSPGGIRIRTLGDGNTVCDAGADGGDLLTISFVAPRSLGLLADGSILVSEQGCHRVRWIRNDSVDAYAGTGVAGYSGDDGPAVFATLHAGDISAGPSFGISLSPEDPPDELFVADTENHVIREVKLFTGRIETLAGTGEPGFVDGPPSQARFNRPTAVFASSDHAVWVVDSGNHAIRRIDPLVTEVRTIAGIGSAGFSGDGAPPESAQLNHPGGVFVTDDGWVFIADTGNNRIRLFAFGSN